MCSDENIPDLSVPGLTRLVFFLNYKKYSGLTHLLLPKRSYLRSFDDFLKLIILVLKNEATEETIFRVETNGFKLEA